MADVNGLTAERMLEIEAASVVSGSVDGAGELSLHKHDGSTIDAGNIKGPQGDRGPIGASANPIDLLTPFLAAGPLVIAHRGAGKIYPENSMEGFRAVAAAGFAPETDIRVLSTGQAVLCHDDTTDRTMTATGTVSALTLAQWRSRFIRPQIPGGDQAQAPMWIDLLNEMGGRYLLVPEIKVAGSQAPLIQPVIDRNLQKAVLFQSFDLATAQAIAAAGCQVIFLTAATITGTTPAALVAAGIKYVGFSTAVTTANVTAAKNAGLKVFIYTVDTAADWTASITTKGADGVFTNDPWFVSSRFAPQNSDPFNAPRDAWPHLIGMQAAAGVAGTPLTSDDLAASFMRYAPPVGIRMTPVTDGSNVGTLAVAMGWAGKTRGPRIRVRSTIVFLEAAPNTARWTGIFIGSITDPDKAYDDGNTSYGAPGQTGYHCLIRRTGALQIYKVAPNTPSNQIAASSVPGSPIADVGVRSGQVRLEVVIDANGITFTNLNSGNTATVADTTFRAASQVNLTVNQTQVEWQSVGVEDLP